MIRSRHSRAEEQRMVPKGLLVLMTRKQNKLGDRALQLPPWRRRRGLPRWKENVASCCWGTPKALPKEQDVSLDGLDGSDGWNF